MKALQELINDISTLRKDEIDCKRLQHMVAKHQIDINQISDIVIDDNSDYFRKPILQDLVNIYLMYWPAGIVSSIHQHSNFGSIIKVCKGKLYERSFKYLHEQLALEELAEQNYKEGDILIEEPNAIHEVSNPSQIEMAVSLHVYFPGVQNLSGSRLFDVKKNKIAILSDKASSFGWNQPEEAFSEVSSTPIHII